MTPYDIDEQINLVPTHVGTPLMAPRKSIRTKFSCIFNKSLSSLTMPKNFQYIQWSRFAYSAKEFCHRKKFEREKVWDIT